MRKKTFHDIERKFVARHAWIMLPHPWMKKGFHGCARVFGGALYSSHRVIYTNDTRRSIDGGFQVMMEKMRNSGNK